LCREREAIVSTETTSVGRVSLEAARHAVAELTPKLTHLLRSVSDPAAPAVGTWTAGDVAAHLAHVVGLDLEAVRGPGAETALEAQSVAAPRAIRELKHMTAALLDRDPVRDPTVQAARVEAGIAALLDACDEGDRVVPWLLGITLPRSAVCSHQVYEMLLHGSDIARGAGLEWTISPDLARLAIEGFVLAAIGGLGASDPRHEPLASCEIRLRGGGRFVLALTEAGPAVFPPRDRVDLRMSADPVAMLIGISGRGGSRLARVLSGRIVAWGPHPLRGLRVFDAIKAP
jgi:uncharacterized protein (TIGR03083 family)